MASAHNFLSSDPLSLLTFDDKRPVFLSSTKEKRRHAKDDQKRKTTTQILAMKTKQDWETRAMMASAHNFLSNINSDQCPLSLLTFDDKRPVFLSSTKEKGRHAKR